MPASRPDAPRLFDARFLSFLTAQFLGAANDNAFKSTLTAYILFSFAEESLQIRFTSLATFLFPVPFLLFSPVAGYLADRFRKSRYLSVTKAPELLAMALAIPALAHGSLPGMMLVLFLMATQSAFFSPPKYGLLPESLPPERLSMANGVLNMTTNLAILVGAVTGVLLFRLFSGALHRAAWIYLGIAVAGTLAATFVPRTPAGNPRARPEWNLFACAWRDWQIVRQRPVLVHTMAGIAYFGFLGSVFLAVIPIYGRNVLGLSVTLASLLLMVLSIGIAAGSILAGRLSHGRVEIGLVPLGSVGLTLFSLALALVRDHGPRAFEVPLGAGACLLGMGLSAGLYIVPLNALLQQRSPEGMKGRLIAFSNVWTFTAVLVAAGFPWLLSDLFGLPVERLVLIVSATTALATIYILSLLPDFFVRLVLYVLTNTLYRIEASGEERIPREGALLVANHVSWVDPFLIGASTDRMIRFLMFRPYYELPILRGFFRRMRVIPVASGDSPEKTEASLELARGEIRKGHVVCIFAEGAVTRTGNLLRFRRGFERIAAATEAPIVPVLLDGVWGSVFSWERGQFLVKRPRRLREPVRVLFGEPMPSSTPAAAVRARIQELSAEAVGRRPGADRTLTEAVVRTARRRWFNRLAEDPGGRSLRFGEALVEATAVGARLARSETDGRTAVLLPVGLDAARANLALLLGGLTLVNLDPEADPSRLGAQIEVAGVTRVITDRAWLTATGLAETIAGLEQLELNSLSAGIGRWSRLRAWAACRLMPIRSILPAPRDGATGDPADETAALIFSRSPHLGERTVAACLTHRNILSNMESLRQVFRISPHDRILGPLTLANSFGLIGTLLLPAVAGFRVVFRGPNDDTADLERLLRARAVSILPARPETVHQLIDRFSDKPLPDLRHVIVAGGTVSADGQEAFHDRFGVEPLEGFGCAECAPLVSLNLPSRAGAGTTGASHRPGTSGHPLPGLAIRIVDPADGRPLPAGDEGLLWIRGPNVMRGYLDQPELTASVLVDGWYRSGMRARVDEDGFLTVLGPA